MATPYLDYDRAAIILVQAAFYGEKQTAKEWGIHPNTITNYRKRLANDQELVEIFNEKKAAFEADWFSEIPGTIKIALNFIKQAAREANHKDPDVIHAVAGAMKIAAEIGLTKEFLDAKLKIYQQDREDGPGNAGYIEAESN